MAQSRRFDLITCVHGLHYIGDKLAVLTRIASWLTDDGQFSADLDLDSIRLADGRPAGRKLAAALRDAVSPSTPAVSESGGTGPVSCRCHTCTSAPMTALDPITPASRRSTPTTPKHSGLRCPVAADGMRTKLPLRLSTGRTAAGGGPAARRASRRLPAGAAAAVVYWPRRVPTLHPVEIAVRIGHE